MFKFESLLTSVTTFYTHLMNSTATFEGNENSFFLPGEDSSPKEVLAEAAPKNCSYRRRDSGTGLTMNRRPAECTTWAVVLGEIPEGNKKVSKKVRSEV